MTSNKQRAWVAAETLKTYATIKRDMEWENDMTRLTDLLTDLMHFCNRNSDREDCPMNFENALTTAEANFEAEK